MRVKMLNKLWRRHGGTHAAAPDPYGLSLPQIALSNGEYLYGHEIMGNGNWSILGAVASGKTTSSGSALSRTMLRNNAGIFVLTYKKNECERWVKMIHQEGRQDSLIVIRPGGEYYFNFIDYLAHMPGLGLTQNIVEALYTVGDMAERNAGSYGGDRYWRDSGKELLTAVITVLLCAEERLTLKNIREFILSAPQSSTQIAEDKIWQSESLCLKCISKAEQNLSRFTPERQESFRLAESYFMRQWPCSIPEKTRGSIISTVTSMLNGLMSEVVRDLCTAERSNFCPDLALQGACVILDIPVQTYGEVGQYIQVLLKHLMQKAIENRDMTPPMRPICIWLDEAHYFVRFGGGGGGGAEYQFLSTSREMACTTALISQNISNYFAAAGDRGQHEVYSLLGNCHHIFHANSHALTNQFASEMIGRDYRYLPTYSSNEQGPQQVMDMILPGGPSSANEGISLAPHNDWIVPPQTFSKFRTAGAKHRYVADALVFVNGRIFESTGQNFLISEFKQYV